MRGKGNNVLEGADSLRQFLDANKSKLKLKDK